MGYLKNIEENHIEVDLDQWCMYFWIPQAIHMRKGKLAGQVAHASARLARMMKEDDWKDYVDDEVKIVCKIPKVIDLLSVEEEINMNFPTPYQTMVYDNTWETYTVFGIAIRTNLRNKKWKLA